MAIPCHRPPSSTTSGWPGLCVKQAALPDDHLDLVAGFESFAASRQGDQAGGAGEPQQIG